MIFQKLNSLETNGFSVKSIVFYQQLSVILCLLVTLLVSRYSTAWAYLKRAIRLPPHDHTVYIKNIYFR